MFAFSLKSFLILSKFHENITGMKLKYMRHETTKMLAYILNYYKKAKLVSKGIKENNENILMK